MTSTATVLAGRGDVERAAERFIQTPHREPRRVEVVCLAEVVAERVTWLWPGYLPAGKLAVLEGDPGVGKSTLTMAIAAAMTGGPSLPGGAAMSSAPVVVVTYEDGIADTVKPRLEAAGGDPGAIYAIQSVNDRPVTIPDDVPEVTAQVAAMGAKLVIIDPAGAAFGASTDTYVDSDVRRALAPLARMAEETQATVLLVRHLRKAARVPAVMAGAASIGIAAAARTVLGVYRDPTNPSHCVLAIVKCNLAERASSLGFRLCSTDSGVARVEWTGASTMSADALVAARDGTHAEVDGQGSRSTLAEVEAFLVDILGDGVELESKTVITKGRDAGYSPRTIQRALRTVGVVVRREGRGQHHHTLWSIPVAKTGQLAPASPA